MKKLTQKEQDTRRSKAWNKLNKRINLAQRRCEKEIDNAYELYDKEK